MTVRIGVITFPGSLADGVVRAVHLSGGHPVEIWHADVELPKVDAVILPGGSTYGNYLRAGALAARAPIMTAVASAAELEMPVLGVGNGFQILCEAGLLPGTFLPNPQLTYVCADEAMRVEKVNTPWTSQYLPNAHLTVPVKAFHGQYTEDEQTLNSLEARGQVVLRYINNPMGAARGIAGICDETGNVVGLLPQPEYASEVGFGPSTDGLGIFESVVKGKLS